MARTQMVWSGLNEYRATLLALPKELGNEAAHMIEGAANAVTVEIKTAYPWHTGNLRKGVEVSQLYRQADGTIAGAVVTSKAPHAYLYDNGTEARHYFTVNGIKHLTGRMPATHTFVRAIVRARRQLTQRLKAMVLAHGATSVTGGDIAA